MKAHLPRTVIGLLLLGVLSFGAYIGLRSGALWVLGGRSYRFQTTAIYEAPKSRYRLEIHAAGVVEAGNDLSESSHGTVQIDPLSEATRLPLRLTFSEEESPSVQLGDHPPEWARWGWRDRDSTLQSLLERAGYVHIMPEEVRESASVIKGALSGPKGTTMEGQSEVLRVIRVSLRYPLRD